MQPDDEQILCRTPVLCVACRIDGLFLILSSMWLWRAWELARLYLSKFWHFVQHTILIFKNACIKILFLLIIELYKVLCISLPSQVLTPSTPIYVVLYWMLANLGLEYTCLPSCLPSLVLPFKRFVYLFYVHVRMYVYHMLASACGNQKGTGNQTKVSWENSNCS